MPCRLALEESPESRRLFGAGLGARSPQRTPRGKTCKANAVTQKRTKAAPPAPVLPYPVPPRPPATPSGSPQRNGQTRSEPAKADNRADITRTHEWRSRPGGTGTQDTASRPVWRKAANSRRETRAKRRDRNARPGDAEGKAPRQERKAGRYRTLDAARETQRRAMPSAKRRDRNARLDDAEGKTLQEKRKAGRCRAQSAARETQRRAGQPPRAQTPVPELQPAKRNIAPAHYSRSYDAKQHCAASARTWD